MVLCHFKECKNKGDKKCSRCQLVFYCSKEHQLNDWKEHKKYCIPLQSNNNSNNNSNSDNNTTNNNNYILIQTIEGINKKVCQKHKREVCSQCSCDYSSINKLETYKQFIIISQNLLQEENKLKLITTCSNPNCKSKWPATEDFTPPIVNPLELKKCKRCHHVVYCSQECLQENKEEHQMICKLYTPLYRELHSIQTSYCIGTVLEQMYENISTGLKLKIIFFNGDIDPITSLHWSPYYILEYIPFVNTNNQNEEMRIRNEDIHELESISNQNQTEIQLESNNLPIIKWKKCQDNILERLINNQSTETYVHILDSSSKVSEEEKEEIVVEPWVNGKQFIQEDSENLENKSNRFILLECTRLVNEVRSNKWRVVE